MKVLLYEMIGFRQSMGPGSECSPTRPGVYSALNNGPPSKKNGEIVPAGMAKHSTRTNEAWRNDLSSPGAAQEAALIDLRQVVRDGLPYALSKWISPSDPAFDALVEETTQNTLLRVLDRLHTFEGRSKFTTWVHKIAVHIALNELRRKRWQDVSLQKLVEGESGTPALMEDKAGGPELASEQSDLADHIMRIINQELSDRQRTALIAIGIHGMPIAEVAHRMDTNRNALYKLMHDARLRLKQRLAEEGLTPDEILKTFGGG
jgi:RNA polymerase sigma-70 factor (ECF subfamily)